MNNTVIPPSANWYLTSILVCSPDNTLMYGSRNDIVIISDSPADQPADVKVIPRAHSQKIISTGINRNWGQPHKLLVTAAEDNIVKVWDIETRKKRQGHSAHVGDSKIVGAAFAGDDRVISVSEDGVIVIWHLGLDETNAIREIFGLKVNVTCISPCPHVNWLTAFGLKNGLVVVVDLRKQGRVLYKLRGHDNSVLSLAWCPVPINIFPKHPSNYVGTKNSNKNDELPTDHSTSFGEVDKPILHKSIWNNLESDSDILKQNLDIKEDPQPVQMAPDGQMLSELEQYKLLFQNIMELDTSAEISRCGKVTVTENTKTSQENTSKKKLPCSVASTTIEKDFEKICHGLEKTKEVTASCKDETNKTVEEGTNTQETESKEDTNLTNDDRNDETNKTVEEGTNTQETESKEDTNQTNGDKNDECKSNDGLDDGTNPKDTTTVTSEEIKREIPKSKSEREEPRREFLLASAAKERNIYIWRAGTDGRMQTLLTLPNKSGKSSKTSSDKFWVALCWVSPTVLLSSSKFAELIKWKLPKQKDKTKWYRIISHDHSSMVFSIAAPIIYMNECNWLEKKLSNVWSFGHDRLLINTCLINQKKHLAYYPTLGNAECLVLSPVDPNRLAIGTAEGVIKVWDLSQSNIKNIAMTNFYHRIKSKVVTMAWHPTNEMLLAFGTSEGRVGYMDIGNKSKPIDITANFFRNPIHRIEWGPIKGREKVFGLYAVSEGKLVMYDYKSEKAPTEVEVTEGAFVYTFAWKPDYSIFLVCTNIGHVLAFSSQMQLLASHYFQHRIKEICWHPAAIQSDTSFSENCFKFAAVSNGKAVIVYDFIINNDNEKRDLLIAKYEQTEYIHSVAWSPYMSNELVISIDDGISHVWDFKSKTILSSYTSPNFEGILSSIWSPIDSDCIISAIKDHTIRVWKISEYPPQDEKKLQKCKRKVINEIRSEQNSLLPNIAKMCDDPLYNKDKVAKANLLPIFFTPKEGPYAIAQLRKLFMWKQGNEGQDLGVANDDFDVIKLFGPWNGTSPLILENELLLEQQGKYKLSNTLRLFRGDVDELVKRSITEKRVTPWVIMMAPMVSVKTWQLACDTYAQQLSEKAVSDPIEIATFYLACHKVEQAINALCDGNMFREAFVLAKTRLYCNATLEEIATKWAKYSISVGNFEAAAQCFIYMGKFEEAANVLFRRSNLETLQFALEVAEAACNKELHKAVQLRYNALKSETSSEGTEVKLPNRLDLALNPVLKPSKVDAEDDSGSECDGKSSSGSSEEEDKNKANVTHEAVLQE